MIDTASTIRDRRTGKLHMVACVHDEFVFTTGPQMERIPAEHAELVYAATYDERLKALQAMAQSSMPGHRPECARQRLGGMGGYEIVGIGGD